MTTYPAIYRDAHGEEHTVIENDGQTLRMIVRGIEFVSKAFGSFEFLTAQNRDEAISAGFALDRYDDLLAATIIYEMPLMVIVRHEEILGTLTVQVDLEGAGTNAAERPWADPILSLAYNDLQYATGSYSGCFEGAFLSIQKRLPADTFIKCCFNCAFSGYNPSGNGLWGMFCHRNHKEEYLQANNKPLWFRLNRESAETVQETYLCPEFERWNGETGYRDPLQPYVIKTQ